MKYLGGGAIRQLPFMDLFDLTIAVALGVNDFPLEEIVNRLAYPDEKKLIARSAELTP